MFLLRIDVPVWEKRNQMNHLLNAGFEESGLTCNSAGWPLSPAGFKNATSQAGAKATLRDNDLLSRRRTSNSEKN
jgi:hypothetical protein